MQTHLPHSLTSPTPTRPWLQDRDLLLFLFLGAYATGLAFWQWHLGGPGGALVSDLLFLPLPLAAAGLAWRAGGHASLDLAVRRGWRRIGWAFLLYGLGDLLWLYYDGVLGVPATPSWADLFYLAHYPVLLWGMLLFPAAPSSRRGRITFWLDVTTVVLAGSVITWYLLLAPRVPAAEADWLTRSLAVAYPVGDLVLCFGVALLLLQQRRDGAGRALLALGAALLLIFAGDLAYGGLNLVDGYRAGTLPDMLWLAGLTMASVSALVQHREAGRGTPGADLPEGRALVSLHLLPYVAVAATFIPLLTHASAETHRGLEFGAVAVSACVVLRQMLVLQDNRRLLKEEAGLRQELQRSEARFRTLVQHSSDVIAVVEASSRIRYLSPAAAELFGLDPATLVGLDLGALLHPADVAAAMAALSEAGTRRVQCRLRHRDGSWRYVEATVNSLLHDPGVGGVVLNVRDVTERRLLEEQLTHQAFHDALTGLANRALLKDRVGHAVTESRRRKESMAVLFLDLDGFKTINDSLGHTAGDQLLVAVAVRLRQCVRADDTVARLGGDEFAILMEGAGMAEASRVASAILEALAAPFVTAGTEVFVRTSIGIAMGPEGIDVADDLLRNADVAMYSAKGRGKDRFALFEPDMHAAVMQRLELEADLRQALAAGDFVLHYQPTVLLASGRLAGVEALLRWNHPRRGELTPGEFIPLAEETGLIVPLGLWVLREACRQVSQWQREFTGRPPVALSVNLSARQLQHSGLVADLAAVLTEFPLASGTLVLEITESTLMHCTEAVLATLSGLKQLGVLLAIDDFGTGYSSLSYLRRFPVDIVKIDRSFIDAVENGLRDAALVRGIIELSHSLGLTTVAEGVERVEQLSALHALKCHLAQGFYFGRPIDGVALYSLLERDGASANESGV